MKPNRWLGAFSFLFVLGLTVVVFQNCTSGADPNVGGGGGSSSVGGYGSNPADGATTTTTGTATWTGTTSTTTTGTATGSTTTTTGTSTAGTTTGTPTVEMRGYFDSSSKDGNRALLRGWACLVTSSQAVQIKIYVNRPRGQFGSYFIQAINTTIADSAVSTQCSVTGGNLRFETRWSEGTTFSYQNLPIYVYAVDPRNGTEVMITNGNGQLRVPQ